MKFLRASMFAIVFLLAGCGSEPEQNVSVDLTEAESTLVSFFDALQSGDLDAAGALTTEGTLGIKEATYEPFVIVINELLQGVNMTVEEIVAEGNGALATVNIETFDSAALYESVVGTFGLGLVSQVLGGEQVDVDALVAEVESVLAEGNIPTISTTVDIPVEVVDDTYQL
ncbi:MAG: hypothetical protein ACRC5C_01280, partial [Bacilli bacterium]